AGIFTDFDGTLAPIVTNFREAPPLPGAVDLLARLADRYAKVAVVSGRPVGYLLGYLGDVKNLLLSGVYGLEKAVGGKLEEVPGIEPYRAAVLEVAARAEKVAPAGVTVEVKGPALTLHVRGAPQHMWWAKEYGAKEAAATGLVANQGRQSVELRPPVDINKGTVVLGMSDGLEAACFLADDKGDLPGFDALDQLAERGVATLRISVNNPEAPQELFDRSDIVVKDPQGALDFLRELLPG
ncbi:MAG: trehalose-phosphatase, partial [Acidimicrobiales bacterium]